MKSLSGYLSIFKNRKPRKSLIRNHFPDNQIARDRTGVSNIQHSLLIEDVRKHWADRRWPELTNLTTEIIERDIERGEIAARCSVAHMQVVNKEKADSYRQLALDWGFPPEELAGIICAELQLTLSRVKKIAQDQETNPNSSHPLDHNDAAHDVVEAVRQYAHQNSRLHDLTMEAVRSEARNTVQQIESFMNLQAVLEGRKNYLGPLHGWPVSSDLALVLVTAIEEKKYDLVIEFGSGTSTLLMARALELRGRSSTPQIAFEHLEKYHELTTSMLANSGFRSAQVHLTPLKPYGTSEAYACQYYACDEPLLDLSNRYPTHPDQNIFVLVDGPPNKTGKYARLPALPILLRYFKKSSIDILLDDYNRADEKEILEHWRKIAEEDARDYSVDNLQLEKGAVMMRILPKSN